MRQAFKYLIKPYLKTDTNALILELSKNRLDDELYKRKKSLVPINIDLTIVSYNSSVWVRDFFKSLIAQTYPTLKINLFVIDNSSTDDTVKVFQECFKEYGGSFSSTQIIVRPNLGYGNSHDCAINLGKSKYIFITNIDGKLALDALEKVLHTAENDDINVASWELRQKPYEHNKYYDPVTLETPWSSYAAVLIRRNAYEKVGGFEKKIFTGGQDVELSYRFRLHGYRVKYCPSAVIWLNAQSEIQPLKYTENASANSHIKLRYGFNTISRQGKFIKTEEIIVKSLVSIIMRVTGQREFDQLRCSIKTVANQTYNNIEFIVVEDGGSVHLQNCKKLCENLDLNYKYFSLPKVGRSAAGNYGLEHASGEYLTFLDDDDYLFADHIETIMSYLINAKGYVAAYSLAWEAMIDKETRLFNCKNLEVPAGLLQEYDYKTLQEKNFIPIQSIIFKKQLFLELGGFDESLEYLEDWNLWYRYGYKNKFKYIPRVTSMYTVTHRLSEFIARNQKMRASYLEAKTKAQARILEIN